MDVPPELIHGFFQCISSAGTLKLTPAPIHPDLITSNKKKKKTKKPPKQPKKPLSRAPCLHYCDVSMDACGLRVRACVCIYIYQAPRQQKFRAMNGAHLASPIRGELGYAHWPQLGTQFIALLGTKFGAH